MGIRSTFLLGFLVQKKKILKKPQVISEVFAMACRRLNCGKEAAKELEKMP